MLKKFLKFNLCIASFNLSSSLSLRRHHIEITSIDEELETASRVEVNNNF